MLMVDPAVKARFSRLQTRWRDPLLTTLTIMLAVMLFVLAPLQATGIVKSDTFAIALILISTAALFVVSGNLLTIVAILVAIGFSAIAAALRVRHLTLALYFDATAWALLGVSVGWVVARAVFGPGDVTYHRIMGAILLYLDAPGLTKIAEASISSLITYQGIGDVNRIYQQVRTAGADFNLAYVPDSFVGRENAPFDLDYMRALYELGYAQARAGYKWDKKPPDL